MRKCDYTGCHVIISPKRRVTLGKELGLSRGSSYKAVHFIGNSLPMRRFRNFLVNELLYKCIMTKSALYE